MRTFLIGVDRWEYVKFDAHIPLPKKDAKTGEITNQEKIDSWNKGSERALADIRMCLPIYLRYIYMEEENPARLWAELQKEFGFPTPLFDYENNMIPYGYDQVPIDDFLTEFGANIKNLTVSTQPNVEETITDGNVLTGVVDSFSSCKVTINNCGCSSSSLECDKTVEWLADSGASMHFTFDINDFVEYQELAQKIPVSTANSSSHIVGKGTVVLLLQNGELIRIFPVTPQI